jgi:flagellin-specific chaperone FliS
LVPLQDEAIRVIEALAVVQSMVNKASQDSEENITTLTAQVVENILEKEVEVKKKVSTTRETLQNFKEAWKGTMQQA